MAATASLEISGPRGPHHAHSIPVCTPAASIAATVVSAGISPSASWPRAQRRSESNIGSFRNSADGCCIQASMITLPASVPSHDPFRFWTLYSVQSPNGSWLTTGAPGRSTGRGVLHEESDLHAVVHAELDQQPRHVGLDGGGAHVQLGGDVGVRTALTDRGGHLVLPWGQRREPLSCLLAPGGRTLVARNQRDQAAGDR